MDQTLSEIYPGRSLDVEDSFRLLELQPGGYETPITARLITCSIGSIQYEAISYVWGDISQMEEIYVIVADDNDKLVKMHVTVNCHAALKRLRKEHGPRTLWIDSICINQALVLERNHQVTLMTRIYQGANRVVVYLGKSADNSDTAMDWIRELDQPSDYGSRPSWEDLPKFPGFNRTVIKALFERTWFHRVWVLQEITLAREAIVICGNREVNWDSFRAFRHWNRIQHWIKDLPYSVDYADSRGSGWSNFIPYVRRLLNMLIATRPCGATDARDKLYAILPLVDWEQKRMISQLEQWQQNPDHDGRSDPDEKSLRQTLTIRADYSRSVQQVFTELTSILLQYFGLDTLRLTLGQPVEPNSPSWVTNWSAMPKYLFMKPPKSLQHRRFFAGFRKRPERNWNDSVPPSDFAPTWSILESSTLNSQPTTQLQASAVEIGVIAMLGDTCDIGNNIFPIGQWASLGSHPKWWHDKAKMPETITDQHAAYLWEHNSELSLPPFIRTLAADDIVYPEVIYEGVESIQSYNGDDIQQKEDREEGNKFRQTRHVEKKTQLRDIFDHLPISYKRQSQHLFQACDGRRFFITNNGDIGLAPDVAAVGDSVFVLEGCSVPFVLRSLALTGPDNVRDTSVSSINSEDSATHRLRRLILVGESWVYGIMRGEIWDKVADKTSNMCVEEIVIQ